MNWDKKVTDTFIADFSINEYRIKSTWQGAGRLTISHTSGGAEELYDPLRIRAFQHLIHSFKILTAGAVDPLTTFL